MPAMQIAILGGGAWGTALAAAACSSTKVTKEVTLWLRDKEKAKRIQVARCNDAYLPGAILPPALTIDARPTDHLVAWLSDFQLVILATPMSQLRHYLTALSSLQTPVLWVCKGFEPPQEGSTTGLLGHEILAQTAPHLPAGVLSGPSFALEVAQKKPTALVVAGPNSQLRSAAIQAFHTPLMRIYESTDITGVEVGGAIKNIMAIATGLCDGLNLGLNARAALITRGLAEMTRLGVALGAQAETFMGLSGLGDLVLTATGDLSRNRKVGLQLAQGLNLTAITNTLGHVAEGVYSAKTVLQRAQSLNVQMPITHAVVQILEARLSPQQALGYLMERSPAKE